MRLVIDDVGQQWATSDWPIRRHFCAQGTDNEVEHMLVRLVGCVALRQVRSHAGVLIKPSIVTQACLAELYYILCDLRPATVSVRDISTNVHSLFRDLAHAIKSIDGVVAAAARAGSSECQTTDLMIDLIDETSAFGELLRQHAFAGGLFDLESYIPILEQQLAGRWLAVEPSDCGDDMRVLGCGTGYGIPTPEFCDQLNGALLSSLPDSKYARWVAQSYGRAVREHKPLFQSARSIAYWSDVGMVESEYARLIVPMRQKNGRPALLSTSRRFGLRRLIDSSAA